MKTLLLQTAMRPNAQLVNYRGTLRGWWRSTQFAACVWAPRGVTLTCDEANTETDLRAPVVVVFSGTTDATLITIYDAESGTRLDDDTWDDDDTHMELMDGRACDVVTEGRTVLDIRDNPANVGAV